MNWYIYMLNFLICYLKKIFFLNKIFIKKFIKIFYNSNMVNNSIQDNRLLEIIDLTLPEKFFVLVSFKAISNNLLRVKIGDKVLRGQILALGNYYLSPIHSPSSGIVVDIVHNYLFFSDTFFSAVIILSDGKDQWVSRIPIMHDYKKFSSSQLIELIYNFGIVGLSGSGFMSSKKLKYAIGKVHTLVVNAVESEPWVTSDDCLIQNFSEEIIQGCKILTWILKIKKVLIVLSEGKLISFNILKKKVFYYSHFKLLTVKNKYPAGSSKQLIKTLFGKEIPEGKHSIDLGIIMYNVSTVRAIKRAVLNGEPLTERIITLSGNGLSISKNLLVRIGTPIKHILAYFCMNSNQLEIRIGGPMTGIILKNLNFSILKVNNCILFSSVLKNKFNYLKEQNCIRCKACSNVCPMGLLPEELYWYSRYLNHDKSKKYKILDCIECGLCEQVCPSHIPLMSYYRREKKQIFITNLNKTKAKIFKDLFLIRQDRLNREKINNDNVIFSQYISCKKFKLKIKNIKN